MNLELVHIGKRYDKRWIFKDINAEFAAGKVHAITGQNGSGKSTLLQIIAGFISPNEGKVLVNGADLPTEQFYQAISICAPSTALSEDMKVREAVRFHFKFKTMKSGWNAHSMLEALELDRHADQTLEHLSSGMLQRLKLMLCLCSDTPLLLMDEPYANLDERWSRQFNDWLDASGRDRTVIVSSNERPLEMDRVNGKRLKIMAKHA